MSNQSRRNEEESEYNYYTVKCEKNEQMTQLII